MKTIAITGSKAKSTTTCLVRHILRSAGRKVGLIGTFEYDLSDGRRMYANNTTPGPENLDAVQKLQRDAGAEFSVFEVASGSLSDNRMRGKLWDLGAITSIKTGHHVDANGGTHPDFADYVQSKHRMADHVTEALFLNADDPLALEAAGRARCPVIRYGIGNRAEYQAEVLTATIHGTELLLKTPDGPAFATTRMLGRHQAYNALLAYAICRHLGIAPAGIVAGIETMTPVYYRLEPVAEADGIHVLLDIGHPVSAMERTFAALREIMDGGRIVIVFGACGKRDPARWASFGEAIGRGADVAVLTSDDPCGRDPAVIAETVKREIPSGIRCEYIEDRVGAIERAIRMARPGDVVLVCGRGAGTTDLRFDTGVDESVVFSDHVAVRSAMRRVYGFSAVPPAEAPCPLS